LLAPATYDLISVSIEENPREIKNQKENWA